MKIEKLKDEINNIWERKEKSKKIYNCLFQECFIRLQNRILDCERNVESRSF